VPDVLFRVLSPLLDPVAVVREIEFAVDDGPGLRIDSVLVRRRFGRCAHGAIAVVLRRVVLPILDEQGAMLPGGEAPAQLVPDVFEFGTALNGSPVSEIGDRIVTAD